MITKNKVKIIISLFILFFFIVIFNFKKRINFYLKNQLIFPNVFVDEINVGGKNQSEFFSLFSSHTKKINEVKLEIVINNKEIATLSAKLLNLTLDTKTAYYQAFLVGRSTYFPSRIKQMIFSILSFEKYYFSTNIKYNNEVIENFIERAKEKYNYPAKNALFKFENGKVVAFKKEEEGQEVDEEEFLKSLNSFFLELKKTPKNKRIYLPIKIIKPEITLAKINNFGIEELIGEGSSNFSHSSSERIHNIILASSKFNGVLIPKDKIFSFNDTIGDVSVYAGYKQAYIIKEGKTVLGDGGGICQVSTTLFRAAINSGLPIIERHAHAYRVYYYENDSKPGFDATVFAPQVDLKIKNDTPAYVLIQTNIDKTNQILTIRLYGKKDGRKIEISPVTIWGLTPPPDPLYHEDPTLKKGVIKQIDFPAWGAKTKFNYKVTLNDKILFEKEFFSLYKPWRAVFLVGISD